MLTQRNRWTAALCLMAVAGVLLVDGCGSKASDDVLQASRLRTGEADTLGQWEITLAQVVETPAGLAIHTLGPVELYILEQGASEPKVLGGRGEGPGEMVAPAGLIAGSPGVFAVGSRGRSLHPIGD